jgi:hypothetical protein
MKIANKIISEVYTKHKDGIYQSRENENMAKVRAAVFKAFKTTPDKANKSGKFSGKIKLGKYVVICHESDINEDEVHMYIERSGGRKERYVLDVQGLIADRVIADFFKQVGETGQYKD